VHRDSAEHVQTLPSPQKHLVLFKLPLTHLGKGLANPSHLRDMVLPVTSSQPVLQMGLFVLSLFVLWFGFYLTKRIKKGTYETTFLMRLRKTIGKGVEGRCNIRETL
jgi:hypothetical protein